MGLRLMNSFMKPKYMSFDIQLKLMCSYQKKCIIKMSAFFCSELQLFIRKNVNYLNERKKDLNTVNLSNQVGHFLPDYKYLWITVKLI